MRKTDLQQMREYHRCLILRHIRETQPVSQAQLTRITNLSPTTVSNITKTLLADDLVCVCGYDASMGGRPPTLLKLHPDGLLIGAVDLGPSRVLAAVGDLTGELRGTAEEATPADYNPATLMDLSKQALTKACSAARVDLSDLHAASIGLPGMVNSAKGIVVQSHNLGWHNVAVQAEMEKRLGIPVLVNNIILLATLAESRLGAGRGLSHLICVGAGSGIGAGAILDGRLYRGPHDVALEIGHTAMALDGPLCRCGHQGCLEALAAGPAVAKRAEQLYNEGLLPALNQFVAGQSEVTARMVHQAALAGDATCARLLAEAGRYLGLGIANLINLFGIETVVIGGGLASAGDFIMNPLQETVQRHVFAVAPESVSIRTRMLGRIAPLHGAVLLALDELVFAPDWNRVIA